jgi:hypothetical protein
MALCGSCRTKTIAIMYLMHKALINNPLDMPPNTHP